MDDLKEAWEFSQRGHLPRVIIGSGSNVLVSDNGVSGIVIHLANDWLEFAREGEVRAGAGLKLDECVAETVTHGWRGLENLSGIPGTVGGGVYGNAGAWGRTIGEAVSWVRFFDGQQTKELSGKECAFGYRTSIFKSKSEIVLWEIGFNLEPGNSVPLNNLRQAILAYRRVRYPPRAKSAGSFFKNVPLGAFSERTRMCLPAYAFSGKEISAGYLIEQAQLLGICSGKIQTCPHQGNFFINRGQGTSQDVLELVKRVQEAVFKQFGVVLEPEVQYLGFPRISFGAKPNQ